MLEPNIASELPWIHVHAYVALNLNMSLSPSRIQIRPGDVGPCAQRPGSLRPWAQPECCRHRPEALRGQYDVYLVYLVLCAFIQSIGACAEHTSEICTAPRSNFPKWSDAALSVASEFESPAFLEGMPQGESHLVSLIRFRSIAFSGRAGLTYTSADRTAAFLST